ncbi:hypothetical protein ACMDB5_12995 [Flavobacterium sp. W1B]|uniref:hypothetical protein n=1 Tax=Flavobacterium sp. W1B TaxID=3394146 RepID=UPI0039BD92DC
MYSMNQIRQIFSRCKDYFELEKACDGLLMIIEDGDLTEDLTLYAKHQANVRFRQLKC